MHRHSSLTTRRVSSTNGRQTATIVHVVLGTLLTVACVGPVRAQNSWYDISTGGFGFITPEGPQDRYIAQQFLTNNLTTFQSLQFPIVIAGTAAGKAHVEIWSDSGSGEPGDVVERLGSIDLSTLPRATWETITIEGPKIELSSNTPYFIVVDNADTEIDGSNNYTLRISGNRGANGARGILVQSTNTDWLDFSVFAGRSRWLWMTVDAQVADPLVGDFNGNGSLDAQDIDMLTDQIVGALNSPLFDLNGDGQVDRLDHRQWVVSLKNTWYGDSDLNGEFNTGDLVAVFQAGEYEDLVPLNSRWSTGDWNGDKEFNTSDLVTAFQDGGFERGPRQAAVLVPEPTAFLMFALGALIASRVRRVRTSRSPSNNSRELAGR